MSDTTAPVVLYERKSMAPKITLIGFGLLILGIIMLAVAYMVDPTRAAFDNVIVLTATLSIGLGSLFLVALEFVAHADWSVPFRRLAEILTILIVVALVLGLPVLMNMKLVFPWADPAIMQGNVHLMKKVAYLKPSAFMIRFFGFSALFLIFSFIYYSRSVKQDKTKDPKHTIYFRKMSAIFIPIFAIGLSILAMDWIMSLSPSWFSTIFGVYFFAGTVLAGLSVLTIVSITLYENGYLSKYLTEDHFYNFGALMFAFTNFWAYIAFSQFLLIWYGNLPEETSYFLTRGTNGWMALSIALILVRWAVPYFALVTRPSKSSTFRLKFIAMWVFAAHLYDLYWLIMPNYSANYNAANNEAIRLGTMKAMGPVFGWQELAVPIFLAGLIIVVVSTYARKVNLMPIGDPKFKKSLEFHL